MKRKIIPCMLVASLSFSIGCYRAGMVTKEELRSMDKQVDITVFTKDSSEYKFLKENYRIQGDTLTGFGVRRRSVSSDVVLDASFSFADIDSIETRVFDSTTTVLLCGGVGIGTGLIMYILLHNNEQDKAVEPSGVGHL